jgi:predicted enzyme related to lactoylglutathione lyase
MPKGDLEGERVMEITHNVVGWFEIPVSDMERAVAFYETVLDIKLSLQDMGWGEMAMFPMIEGGMGTPGALIRFEETYTPSEDGILIYFTAFSGDLDNELARVEEAGGSVLQPKRLISEEVGYLGTFRDTEGNRVALHSRK